MPLLPPFIGGVILRRGLDDAAGGEDDVAGGGDHQQGASYRPEERRPQDVDLQSNRLEDLINEQELTSDDIANHGNTSINRPSVQDEQDAEPDAASRQVVSGPVDIAIGPPAHPVYGTLMKRLGSYPTQFYHVHTVVDLADAGFFFAGYADCVRCFQCGLGIRSWKPGDSIYKEHRKFRPDCQFLQMKMRENGIHRQGLQSDIQHHDSQVSELTSDDIANHGNTSINRPSVQDEQDAEPDAASRQVVSGPVDIAIGPPAHPVYGTLMKRLGSYPTQFYHVHTVADLADAGFFFAGYADCVRCFQCGLGIRSWKPGDSIYEEHRKFRPDCQFLQMKMRENGIHRQGLQSDILHNDSHTSELTSDDIANHGNTSINRPSVQDEQEAEADAASRQVVSGPVDTVSGPPSHPVYVTFKKRLGSYPTPFNHVHTATDLADAGFFFAGYADCVRCFQCGLGLRSWKPGDSIYEEHRKIRPDCQFLQMKMRANEIHRQGLQSDILHNDSHTSELTSDDIANHGNTSINRPSVQDEQEAEADAASRQVVSGPVDTVSGPPSHPVYVTFKKRLGSYPTLFNHVHTATDLADAGFFFAGYADCVRCFQCGLGLRSWKPGDSIYEKHRKNRPDCQFLQMKMRANRIHRQGLQSDKQHQDSHASRKKKGLFQIRTTIKLTFVVPRGASKSIQKITRRVDPRQRTGDLKIQLAPKAKIGAYFQEWQHAGHVLNNNETLRDLGIMKASVISVTEVECIKE